MRDDVALQRYLLRHTETGLPQYRFTEPCWDHVLVLPAYRESSTLLTQLMQLGGGTDRILVILLLNRPDADQDPRANTALRDALEAGFLPREQRASVPIYCLNTHADLYLHDMELLCGPTPAAHGVGVARKTGFDLALQWICAGGIDSQWICSADADAALPPGYFAQLNTAAPDAVAAVFPFFHVPGGEEACDSATALYELRLHHYVLGLEHAGSPYAFHTLGSCLAVKSSAYTHVRGFPKRAGAEDFYLLNKLAKLGPIARLQGDCIELQSRVSARVPFGTGPAVSGIMANAHPDEAAIFYHPSCFTALQALLASLPDLADLSDTASLLASQGIDPILARQAQAAFDTLGASAVIEHCRKHGHTGVQFQRQFHQWFDGFRTLKFVHALRDSGWEMQSLRGLVSLAPQLWPVSPAAQTHVESLRDGIRHHWGWQQGH